MRRLVAVLVFFLCAQDGPAFYAEHMYAPLAWCQTALFEPLPIKVRTFDMIMAVVLIIATGRKDGKGPRVRPMKNALLIAASTIVAWFVLGIARGGDTRAASWQVYLLLSAVLFAFTVATVFKTTAQLLTLAKAVLLGAMYRAVMCCVFYMLYIHTDSIRPIPEFLTTHDDTVLWVATITMIVVNLIEGCTRRPKLLAAICLPILLAAVQFNGRRLAWVSLIAAFMVLYALVRKGKAKRTINRVLLGLAPLIVIYVAVGWGSSARIFKPLKAFATVSTQEDASTKARNVENLGLLLTARTAGTLTGTGFGHKYLVVSNKYSIADFFELWPYVPHNGILGFLAYTGTLGFIGYWLAFPTAMFLNARVARMARLPTDRAAGLLAAAQLVVCANQFFGDMGFFSTKTMYILATSYAVAMRIPISSGVWGAPAPKAQAAPIHPAEQAPAPSV